MKKLDVHDLERMCALKFDDNDLVVLSEELKVFIGAFDQTIGKMNLDALPIDSHTSSQYIDIEDLETHCCNDDTQTLRKSLNLSEVNDYIIVTDTDKLKSD